MKEVYIRTRFQNTTHSKCMLRFINHQVAISILLLTAEPPKNNGQRVSGVIIVGYDGTAIEQGTPYSSDSGTS